MQRPLFTFVRGIALLLAIAVTVFSGTLAGIFSGVSEFAEGKIATIEFDSRVTNEWLSGLGAILGILFLIAVALGLVLLVVIAVQ